jgi:hypothetical protein
MATTDELAAIRKQHRQQLLGYSYGNGEAVPYCFHCSQPWPCDAATLLAALDAAEAEREVLREWVGRTIAALAFARSVIQCGEPWTATCDRTINGAIIND